MAISGGSMTRTAELAGFGASEPAGRGFSVLGWDAGRSDLGALTEWPAASSTSAYRGELSAASSPSLRRRALP